MTTKLKTEDKLRKKVWKIINLVQANQLFVHSKNLTIKYIDEKSKKKGKLEIIELPQILTLCVLNALVPNSAMLLIGGHGGGKTSLTKILGRMFTGKYLNEIEHSIIRGHPQLTEEKLVGTLEIGKLMKDGEEVVKWKTFIREFWKIIDEVNRLTPYAQDILLSLLAEGVVKYYDQVTEISKFSLYATINPQDIGTFELSEPFLDRFGISVPISMPASQDLQLIISGKDEKYAGYDELVQVPDILTIPDLMEIWYYVINKIEYNSEVNNYIHAIIREFTLCTRVDKGNMEDMKPSTGLCSGCHFDTAQNICNKIDSILSVRAAKDLLRYSKALAWLLGLKEVDINIINVVAPYVISHRVQYPKRDLNKSPYWGDKYELSKKLLDLVQKRFKNREICYQITERFQNGIYNSTDLAEMKKFEKNDLIVKHDLLPFIKIVNNKKYSDLAKKIQELSDKRQLEELAKIRDDLIEELDYSNRSYLINWCNRELYEHTVTGFNFKYVEKTQVWAEFTSELPELDEVIKEALSKMQTKQIRTEGLLLEINVTGTEDDSIVNLLISGGSKALKLIDLFKNSDYMEKEEE